jgi:hypothetical protein
MAIRRRRRPRIAKDGGRVGGIGVTFGGHGSQHVRIDDDDEQFWSTIYNESFADEHFGSRMWKLPAHGGSPSLRPAVWLKNEVERIVFCILFVDDGAAVYGILLAIVPCPLSKW